MNKYASHVVAAVLTLWCVAPAFAACPEIPPVARTPSTGSPFDPGNKGVTKLDTQTSDNVRITGGCIDVPQLFVNGINVEAGVSYGVPWSSLGILADGTTDNTASLNALPTGVRITADCAAGSVIRFNGVWLLKSNLDIKFLPGCWLVSYVAGGAPGSYAIEQADLTVPITNVMLDGINIRKDAVREVDRILRAYIDNFKLLNWTFTTHYGAMFLRGSCQEIAYGKSYDASLVVGSPGIRHIGNVPKVVSCPNQPADVWVHHNNIISGDAVYQTCQPTDAGAFRNVSTDGILFELNAGRSGQSAYALIGAQWDGLPAQLDFTCTDIAYLNNTGRGSGFGVLINGSGTGSLGSPMSVTNVRYINQTLSAIDDATNTGTIHMRARDGGIIDGVLFKDIRLIETHSAAFTANAAQGVTDGVIQNVVFMNGLLETPTSQTSGLNWSGTINLFSTNNVTFQNNIIYGAHAGATATLRAGLDDNLGNPRTVTNLRIIGNTFLNLPDTSAGIELRNVAGADVSGNILRPASGAGTITGIDTHIAGVSGPGSTDITIGGGNVVNGLAVPIHLVCNGTTTNVAAFNIGDAGTICP